MCVNLLKQPLGRVSRHSGVNTEFIWWLGEPVSELVDEVETANKFVCRSGSDVCVAFVNKFDPKVGLEYV
jgi:hypothetical protein